MKPMVWKCTVMGEVEPVTVTAAIKRPNVIENLHTPTPQANKPDI
jgi:hypothetical protein